MIEYLTFSFVGLELQKEDLKVPEDLQTHLMHQSLKLITHHTCSRLSSCFSLSFWRTGFGFSFSFSSHGHHFMFYTLFLKTEDLDMFPPLRLVNIQVNGLVMQTVGPSIYFWECSALVAGPSCVLSIEHPNGRLLPETFLHAEARRRGLDDAGPTTVHPSTLTYFYFYLYFPIRPYPPLL